MIKRVLVIGLLLVSLLVACARHTITPAIRERLTVAAARNEISTPTKTSSQITTLPTPILTSTPAYPGSYSGTPTPDLVLADAATQLQQDTYIVRPGDTLTGIAWIFGCSVGELARANGLANTDSIWEGQRLAIPVMPTFTGPAIKLVPDSELIYGPAYIHFDLSGFVAEQDGYLANYTELIDGHWLSGAEIVQQVSQRFSVGPRILLTLLEFQAGWVTSPDPPENALIYPMGRVEFQRRGLLAQLEWAAAELNAGYYAWRQSGTALGRLIDDRRVAFAPGLNAGTVGIQHYLASVCDWSQWQRAVAPGGFAATYEHLFGNPFAYTIEPLIPSDLAQPEMRLPWPSGETWYLTGGPHEGWGRGSAWAALDFVPADMTGGCTPSRQWATAAAGGLVLRSETGEVVIDLDGDGREQSGWVLIYLHISANGRVAAGNWIKQGERIGHPSCEGGFANAAHLHLARRFNGEWIPAGAGAAPFILSGWMAHEGSYAYDGTLANGDSIRTACECMLDDYNGFVSDNPLPKD